MLLKLNEKLEVLYFQLIAVAPGTSFTLYLIEITMAALSDVKSDPVACRVVQTVCFIGKTSFYPFGFKHALNYTNS